MGGGLQPSLKVVYYNFLLSLNFSGLVQGRSQPGDKGRIPPEKNCAPLTTSGTVI